MFYLDGEGLNGHCYNEELDLGGEYYNSCKRPFNQNHNYYHSKYYDLKIIHQTEKAYLLENNSGKFWVPKKLCRFKNKEKTEAYIWKNFEIKYLEE